MSEYSSNVSIAQKRFSFQTCFLCCLFPGQTRDKERGERVWRERLQRCQCQLKAKEDEMSRQSQYFENFKVQLQHKLNVSRDKERSLQNRIYTLEKQLLDMAVSAATGRAAHCPVRITAAGSGTLWGDQERLPSLRGEGEGEEEKREDAWKQWQPNVGDERRGSQQGVQGVLEIPEQGEGTKDTRTNSNESRLQDFILSLQEDLRVLLEREEVGLAEQRKLMEQLQDAQEKSRYLGYKVEEMEAQVKQLQLSESSLTEEVEELKEENHRPQRACSQSGTTFQGPTIHTVGSCKPTAGPPSTTNSSWWSSGQVRFLCYRVKTSLNSYSFNVHNYIDEYPAIRHSFVAKTTE